MSTEITTQKQNFSLAPKDLDEAMRFADMLAGYDVSAPGGLRSALIHCLPTVPCAYPPRP